MSELKGKIFRQSSNKFSKKITVPAIIQTQKMHTVASEIIAMSRNKDHQLFREDARDKYTHEKREIHKEFQENQEILTKLFNEKYEFYDEVFEHNQYHVIFKKSKENSYQEIVFQFEENYNHLKPLWEINS